MTETLIDKEAWEMLKSMTEPSFLAELIEVYQKDTPELIQQIQAGLSAGDIELVRRSAHSLKSNSASLGANQLAGAARELELIAKSGSLEEGEAKLAAIEAAYEKILPVLEELINE